MSEYIKSASEARNPSKKTKEKTGKDKGKQSENNTTAGFMMVWCFLHATLTIKKERGFWVRLEPSNSIVYDF